MKTIVIGSQEEHLEKAVKNFRSTNRAGALTGAGISVACGIPDFRSPGGLWSLFNPDEYATLDVFISNPEKAWLLYRELGLGIVDKQPSTAHGALADFEQKGQLDGIVTQNIDTLHQKAGSTHVYEIHGDHNHLQCIKCGYLEEVNESHYTASDIPHCHSCNFPLKPNIVLFGEQVRSFDDITFFISGCDLLLVIGTSAQIYPAAGLPLLVKQNGGKIYEFNMQPSLTHGIADYFFAGDLERTLPAFHKAVCSANPS